MACVQQAADSFQLAEIEVIKNEYPGLVKVISNVGEFTSVVTVQPVKDIDFHIKFQLTATYPSERPTLSIRSSSLSPGQKAELFNCMNNFAEWKSGNSCISTIVGLSATWLEQNDISIQDTSNSEKSKSKKSKSKSQMKTKQKKAQTEVEEDKFVKKPSMKTALDVIKRLQWDESVNKEDFIVGYIDRIVGLVEKSFTAFTWEDLASVDNFTLAIPQHRIQYFKYKSVKVWDKNERLDNVFGSAGNSMTLIEAVQKHEQEQLGKSAGNSTLSDSEDNQECRAENQTTDTVDGDNDTADHPDNVVTDSSDYGATRNSSFDTYDEELAVTSQPSDHTINCRMPRFNFFLAFQVTEEDLVRNLVEIQDQFLSRYPRYAKYRIPSNGFHLTLALLNLRNTNDQGICVEAVQSSKSAIQALGQDCGRMSFRGLDSFSSAVIFTKVEDSSAFAQMVATFRSSLRKAGIEDIEAVSNTHLTLFKVPKSVHRYRDGSDDQINLGAFSAKFLGSQFIDNIKLCRMGPINDPTREFAYDSIWTLDLDYGKQN